MNLRRITWVVHTFGSGGIGPVCRYTAAALGRLLGYEATVVALHQKLVLQRDPHIQANLVGLNLPLQDTHGFLLWLADNPQDVVVTNDVGTLEPYYPFFPANVAHIVQMHDSGKRYLAVAVRNYHYINAVVCVAEHITRLLKPQLDRVSFSGPVVTVHNGADFPPAIGNKPSGDRLRMLFMGSLDPLIKGVFDLVPILKASLGAHVPCRLTIVGGNSEVLAARFRRARIDQHVIWMGRIPHEQCYRVAAENDVLLMTSRREPFGMVTIEAMAMGCVPLAYEIESGTREIIEHGESGFLLPLGSAKAWARALTLLHQDRTRLKAMGLAAAARARMAFSADQAAAKWNTLLGSLKGGSSSSVERRCGQPLLAPGATHIGAYHKLPSLFRRHVRIMIAPHPRLSRWVLSRWS